MELLAKQDKQKWGIVFHEILGISNTFRNSTDSNLGSSETEVDPEVDPIFCKSFNNDVSNEFNYFTKKGNRYIILETKF